MTESQELSRYLPSQIDAHEDLYQRSHEHRETHADLAEQEFRRLGLDRRITVRRGRAEEILAGLEEPYDVVLEDAGIDYDEWLPHLTRLTAARRDAGDDEPEQILAGVGRCAADAGANAGTVSCRLLKRVRYSRRRRDARALTVGQRVLQCHQHRIHRPCRR